MDILVLITCRILIIFFFWSFLLSGVVSVPLGLFCSFVFHIRDSAGVWWLVLWCLFIFKKEALTS